MIRYLALRLLRVGVSQSGHEVVGAALPGGFRRGLAVDIEMIIARGKSLAAPLERGQGPGGNEVHDIRKISHRLHFGRIGRVVEVPGQDHVSLGCPGLKPMEVPGDLGDLGLPFRLGGPARVNQEEPEVKGAAAEGRDVRLMAVRAREVGDIAHVPARDADFPISPNEAELLEIAHLLAGPVRLDIPPRFAGFCLERLGEPLENPIRLEFDDPAEIEVGDHFGELREVPAGIPEPLDIPGADDEVGRRAGLDDGGLGPSLGSDQRQREGDDPQDPSAQPESPTRMPSQNFLFRSRSSAFSQTGLALRQSAGNPR